MSDPAIEAAQRALIATRGHGNSTVCEIKAAREALKPIRELHYPRPNSVSAMYPDPLCNCGYDWPCDTAKLVYAESELTA